MNGVIIVGRDAASDRITGDETITALHNAVGVISSDFIGARARQRHRMRPN